MWRDILNNILTNTTFLTVLSGSIVFVIGQLFLEIFIKPWEKYKSVKSQIIYFLYKYRECIYNPISREQYIACINSNEDYQKERGQRYKEAELKAKDLASSLSEFLENRGICFMIPGRKRIRIAINELFWLSACFIGDTGYNAIGVNLEAYKEIVESLHLKNVEKWSKSCRKMNIE